MSASHSQEGREREQNAATPDHSITAKQQNNRKVCVRFNTARGDVGEGISDGMRNGKANGGGGGGGGG